MKRRLLFLIALMAVAMAFVTGCKTTENGTDPLDTDVDVKKTDGWVNPNFVGGKTKVVRARGESVVKFDDYARAKDEAIQEAQKNAIVEAIGTVINSTAVVENARFVGETISESTKGYVESYDIIETGEDKEYKIFWIEIEAKVGMDMIEDNPMAIMHEIDSALFPRFITEIEEKGVGTNGEEWETQAFASKLQGELDKKYKFTFVESGSKVKPDIVIKGTMTAQSAGLVREGGKMRSFNASGEISVVIDADGTEFGNTSCGFNAPHISDIKAANKALEGAAEKAAEEVAKKILAYWAEKRINGDEFTLQISGLDDFIVQRDYERKIKEHIRGVADVFKEETAGAAFTLTVRFRGSSDDLAEKLVLQAGEMGYSVDSKNLQIDGKIIKMNVTKKE